GDVIRHKGKFSSRYSLLSAFAIQVPEQFGFELFEVVPDLIDSYGMRNAIISSIVWRSWNTLVRPPALMDYLNKQISSDEYYHRDFFNTLLSMSCTPDNPFNADYVHTVLSRWTLRNRDAWWSTFLLYQYDSDPIANSSIARLLE